MGQARIVVVTPALAAANNGNWQTASRWAGMLRNDYPVRLTAGWAAGDQAPDDDLMIALHARRSAPSGPTTVLTVPQCPDRQLCPAQTCWS